MWEMVDAEVRSLRIADTSSDPTQNGELTRNGSTTRVYQNGSVADLAAGGSGGYSSGDILYGDLTTSGYRVNGTNDATAVQNAIDDAGRNGRSIIIPELGQKLDWDQQVNIPSDENGFAIKTFGLPWIEVPSGETFDHVFRKPGTGSQIEGYRFGNFVIEDNANTLDPAISISDLKESYFAPSVFYNCPALELLSDNDTFCNQNKIEGYWIKGQTDGSKQAGIYLGGSSGTADQNWIYYPLYNETNANSPDSQTVAFHDEGAFNSWILTRAEFADTIHLFDGCREYYVSEGGWDRTQEHRRTVEERNGARGKVELREASRYEALDIVSPQTKLEVRGRYLGRTNQLGEPVDVLDDLKRVTGARSLASMGLRDNSSGGSVTVGGVAYGHPPLEWSTGASVGNTAVLDLGSQSLKAVNAFPKVSYSFGGDTTGVIVRHGFYVDDNNRCELTYDSSSDTNWQFTLVDGGSTTSVDMGEPPGTTVGGAQAEQAHAINFLETGSAGSGDVWTAAINGGENGVKESITGSVSGQGTWRWYVESTDGSDKNWTLEPKDAMRFYRA